MQDASHVVTVTGTLAGTLHQPRRVQTIDGLARLSLEDVREAPLGFSTDSAGNTIFAYVAGAAFKRKSLIVMSSHDGSRFAHPRTLTSTRHESLASSVFAGGTGSFLALWDCGEALYACHAARRGFVDGPLEPTFTTSARPTAFIDSRGRAVILSPGARGIRVITASRRGPFGRPLTVAQGLHDCRIGSGNEIYPPPTAATSEEVPIVPSANGRVIFSLLCNEQYLIRYTP